jgi:hypothetical protein
VSSKLQKASCVLAAALPLSLGACGGSKVDAPTSGFGPVYETIFSTRCLPCHDPSTGIDATGATLGKLDLSTEALSYANLVGVKATGVSCVGLGLTLVVPGSAQSSLLFGKVDGPLTMMPPACGAFMPNNGTTLNQAEVNLIQTWIDDGAKR